MNYNVVDDIIQHKRNAFNHDLALSSYVNQARPLSCFYSMDGLN